MGRMLSRRRSLRHISIGLPFVLLSLLLFICLIAGGASRADALGQMVSRGAAIVALIAACIFANRPRERLPLVSIAILASTVMLAAAQLVPLPPAWWTTLPGHSPLGKAIVGEQPWRPLAIQPGATINATMSLLVPAATLLLAGALREAERPLLVAVMLVLITLGALFGIIQFAGAMINNPLINDSLGEVSGPFANRNHFALFLAFGCLLAPVWAAWDDQGALWRLMAGMGLLVLFLLLILASGSRAGFAAGGLGTLLGLAMAHRLLRRLRQRWPRWAEAAMAGGLVAAMVCFLLLSVVSGRAQSIDRLLAMDTAADMRTRGLPVVLDAAHAFFPLGAGFGSFDAVFRMREPLNLLKPTYFNHAHNDFLELVIDGGLSAVLILLLALAWLGLASIRVWRSNGSTDTTLGRLGSALLFLVLFASAFDYPARTPTIMAIVALAAAWLEWGAAQASLPSRNPNL
jgi:O-antigen ligase